MAAIIECFEIFTGKQLNLKACSQMISSYKHNHTMEYLLGGIPREDFFFQEAREVWEGTSDKLITLHCGFLGSLLLGDIDRGFDIQKCFGILCAEVKQCLLKVNH